MPPQSANELEEFLDQPAKSSRRRYGLWLIALAIVAGLIGLFALLLGKPPGPEYLTDQVRRGDISVTVTATGNLAPTIQVDVGSEISGIAQRVMVKENDIVVKDQPLAIIDPSRLEDTVLRSVASLQSAQATVARERATEVEASTQLERLQTLQRLSGGQEPSALDIATQKATFERAKAAVVSAEANVASARAQLSSDRTQVAKAVIRSPVAGVVLKRTIDPGQTVQAAFSAPSLFILAEDLRRMTLEVSVDEADVGQVKAGQQAQFTVDAYPRRVFPARITRLDLGAKNLAANSAAASASNVVSYLATLELSNRDLTLRPGMTATAVIQTEGEKNALIVPNAALRFTPTDADAANQRKAFQFRPPNTGGQTQVDPERGIGAGSTQLVFVLDDSRKLKPVTVVTGRTNGRETAVTSGELKPGMIVVTGQKAAPSDE